MTPDQVSTKEAIETRVGEWVDAWFGWAIVALLIVVVAGGTFAIASIVSRPIPTFPDGFTLAGGGYGGRYHCIPGVDPIR